MYKLQFSKEYHHIFDYLSSLEEKVKQSIWLGDEAKKDFLGHIWHILFELKELVNIDYDHKCFDNMFFYVNRSYDCIENFLDDSGGISCHAKEEFEDDVIGIRDEIRDLKKLFPLGDDYD